MGRRQGFILAGVLLGMLHLVQPVGADDPMAELERRRAEAAEKRLLQAGIGLDGDSLVAFLRERPKGTKDPEEIQRLIRQLGSEDFRERERAASRLKASGPPVLPALQEALGSGDAEVVSCVRACIKDIERHSYVQLYAVVVGRLVKLRPPGVVPKLLDNLDHPDELARKFTYDTLCELVGPGDLSDVVKAIKDKRPLVRVGTIGLTYKFKDQPKVFAPLLLKAMHDENIQVRRKAAGFLGHFASEEGVVAALIEALKEKDDAPPSESTIVGGATSSLGRSGALARPAIPALMKLSKGGSDRNRHSALSALGAIGLLDKESAPVIVPFLVRILEDKTQTLNDRGLAIGALYNIGPNAKAAVPALLKALRAVDDEPDPKYRDYIWRGAIDAFWRIGPGAEAAVPDLIAIMQDKKQNSHYRLKAVNALGSIGPAAGFAIPALSEALNDEDGRVAEKAAEALKQIQP